jgi:tRNA A58 N-methylase Trm61
LAVHAGVARKKRILEVACGSGLHSLYLSKTMLKRGAVLVSTDISEEMMRLA